MSVADDFKTFLSNIAIKNHGTIELRYGEITSALNKRFRDTDSRTANNLQVGSYGRWTAIKGVSDLDMLYIMPARAWLTYKDNGPYALLRDTAEAIRARYPTTTVKVDRLVVRVLYAGFHVEVQPVFERDDGSFDYPDTYNGGAWRVTRPRDEIDALLDLNKRKNRNARRLCKMVRAWKNRHGVVMGGLLIDTLVNNFLESTDAYDSKSYLYYDWMSRDFFEYLKNEPNKERYAALGSRQHVKVKKKFQRKAAKAHEICLMAIEEGNNDAGRKQWRKLYGREFPLEKAEEIRKSALVEGSVRARDTEEFFEDRFPIDIRNDLRIECEVIQNGFRPYRLTEILLARLRIARERKLRFHIVHTDVEFPYQVYWKVKNRGSEAIRRDMVRGQIIKDEGHGERKETSSFHGNHIVHCVIVKDGIVVARDLINVPID